MNRQGDDPSTDAVLGAHYADGDASKRLDEESKVFRPAVRTYASPLWAERITRAVCGIWVRQLLLTRDAHSFQDVRILCWSGSGSEDRGFPQKSVDAGDL